MTDLLLIIYRRRPALSEGIEVLGDVWLLDFWMEGRLRMISRDRPTPVLNSPPERRPVEVCRGC